jgi:REP element-mobilizing transposase RayT
MAKYNPNIHHRRSIRFKGYDYSKSGLYFITINCQNNVYRFGNVVNGEMKLNEFGKIAHEEWIKLEDRFPNFELDTFQIMPNHMHGIISLKNKNLFVESTVGAGFTHALSNNNFNFNNRATAIDVTGFTHALSLNQNDLRATARIVPTTTATIGDIIGAYKSLVANACLDIYKSKNEQMGKFWQRDYYDIIIRNGRSYLQISNYIENNPKNWKKDKFYRK